jgi:hypothetical protein
MISSAIRLLFLFIFFPLYINAQTFNWAIAEGGLGVDLGKSIKFDANNNVIVCGDVAGDPSFRNIVSAGNGLADAFVAKYEPSGNILWVKLVGGQLVDRASDCAVDNNGNVFLAGHFEDVASVDGESVSSSGAKDIFIAKFDANGNTIWLKRFGTSRSEQAYSLDFSEEGHLYMTGTFVQTIQFGNVTLSSSNLYQESFLVKMDLDGNVIWAKNSFAGNTNTTNGVTVLPDSSIAIAGYFSSAIRWDSTEVNGTTSDFEVFVAKFTKDGDLEWLRSGGGAYEDGVNGIASDPSGNIFITGYLAGYASFGNQNTGNSGYNDPFIAKYDNEGNCLWLNRGEGVGLDVANGIACDKFGNVFATGFYENAISFSGQNIAGLDRQIFIVSYDGNGNLRWLKDAGESGTDCGMGINVDESGSVYISGFYLYRSLYDNILLPLPEAEDMFLAKLSQPFTGVAEIQDEIIVYPNPAANIIYIENGQALEIRVLNALGQSVAFSEKGNSQIDVSNLEIGYYYIQAVNQNYTKAYPIVIAR